MNSAENVPTALQIRKKKDFPEKSKMISFAGNLAQVMNAEVSFESVESFGGICLFE